MNAPPRATRLTLAAALAGVIALLAAKASAAPVVVSATGSVVSDYMFRGLRLNATGFQPAVQLDADGLTLGTVGNFPLRDKVRDRADPEVDFYGAWTVPIRDGLSLVPGFTSYHFPRAPTNAGFHRSTFEPNLALNCTVEGVRFTPKVYYDVVLKGPTFELTAFYAYPLQRIGTELDLVATAGTYEWRDWTHDASPRVKAWGDYWSVGGTVPYQITARSRVAIGLAYAEGRDAFLKAGSRAKSVNPLASGRGVVTFSYTFTF